MHMVMEELHKGIGGGHFSSINPQNVGGLLYIKMCSHTTILVTIASAPMI